MKDQL